MSQDNLFDGFDWQPSGNYGKFDDGNVIEAKRTFSRFSLALFTFVIVANISAFLASLIMLLAMGAEKYALFLDSNPIIEMLLSTLPMYLFALPALYLIVKDMPGRKREKRKLPALELPAVPGRRSLARAKSAVHMKDGSILVGTEDTMLAKITGDKVFSFGQVISAGGVHSLDAAPDGMVWGVAGHKEGCGMLFKYDTQTGVTLMGIIPESFAENGRNVAIYRPVTLAVSPDGKYLAVGGADEMSGAVVLKIN